MTTELRGIERLLASRIGLDPVSVGSPLILRAAQQRMRELGLDDLGAYEHRRAPSEPELQALIEEVVVSESWFFRDERPFQWFREYVRGTGWTTRSSAAPGPEPACAGGEEPYSIAMMLWDLGLPPAGSRSTPSTSVTAGWRSPAAGFTRSTPSAVPSRLPGSVLSRASPGLRARSRDPVDGPVPPGQCPRPPTARGSPPYDVVFCRNLLIYLGASARACVHGDDRPAAGGRWLALHRSCRPARQGRRGAEIPAVGDRLLRLSSGGPW